MPSALERKINDKLVQEGLLSTVGHTALDAAGLVPGVGEAADAANVLWYLKEKKYFEAAISAISMVPGIGDVFGKGFKYLSKVAPEAFYKQFGKVITQYWPKTLELVNKSKKLRPYARQMDQAIKQAMQNQRSQGQHD